MANQRTELRVGDEVMARLPRRNRRVRSWVETVHDDSTVTVAWLAPPRYRCEYAQRVSINDVELVSLAR